METVDLKLILLGQPGVGKTCLAYRYLHNSFGDTMSTIGASFAMKKVESESRVCNLGIWDTAGQERFDALSNFYCRGAQVAIICFDLTDKASFNSISTKWIQKVLQEANSGCHVCIVGTKLDLILTGVVSRGVRQDEVERLAWKHDANIFETSAKQGNGINQIFDFIVAKYHERVTAGDTSGSSSRRRVLIDVPKSGCC